jgi:hypothetical protein
MLGLQTTPPGWVVPGAMFDIDFSNVRSFGGPLAQYGSAIGASGRIQSLVTGPGNGLTELVPIPGGNVISIAAYNPRIAPGYGMWVPNTATNICLWSRDLTNPAWTASNVTVAKNQTGANGSANAASSLTATASNGTVLQSITSASATRCYSAQVRRLTGTGPIDMTQDNGATWTEITSQLLTGRYTWNWTPGATVTNPVVGFRIRTSGDAIAVDYCQSEAKASPSIPLPTTTTAVSRTNDEPSFGDPASSFTADGIRILKNIITNGGPWWFLGSYSGAPTVGSGWCVVSDATFNCSGGCDGGTFNFNGASSATTGTAGIFNVNKVAGIVTWSGSKCAINGGGFGSLAGNTPLALSTSITHCGLGNNGAGNSAGPVNGFINRLTFGRGEPPEGFLNELIRPTSHYGNIQQ